MEITNRWHRLVDEEECKKANMAAYLELKLIADRGSLEYGAQGYRKTISVYINPGG